MSEQYMTQEQYEALAGTLTPYQPSPALTSWDDDDWTHERSSYNAENTMTPETACTQCGAPIPSHVCTCTEEGLDACYCQTDLCDACFQDYADRQG